MYDYIISKKCSDAFFGFSDHETEGKWKWVNGENAPYTNWHKGEPNSESKSEDYAMFYWKFSDGTWNDGTFGAGKGEAFLCEWEP
ncbi:hypothetical protein FACS1894196_4840 [Clostridia bacterium]|nr:hypothetical protein FACS1894196_4840 [Clostridia bacterium]